MRPPLLSNVLALAGTGALGLAIGWVSGRAVEPSPVAAVRAPVKVAEPYGAAVPAAPAAPRSLRELAADIGRRLGVPIVIDDAVRADVPGPAVALEGLDASRLESTLRGLFAGQELLFHHGADRRGAGSRLKGVWVYSRAEDFRVGATAWAGSPPAADGERRATVSPAPRPGAAQPAPREADGPGRAPWSGDMAEAAAPELPGLSRLVLGSDAPQGLRLQALEAYVIHPAATDGEVRALLDQVGSGADPMLAEHARVLREARSAEVVPLPLDPVEDRP